MVNRRRKKNTKMRGSKTHGYGSMKKHRGAGHRGGRGNAGSGKRSGAKKPSFWGQGPKDPAKRGFFSFTRVDHKTINVGHVSSIAHSLVRSGHAHETAGVTTIDLTSMGYEKLLGSGKVNHKLKITVAIATPAAQEKVQKAGGSLEGATIVDKETVKSTRDQKAKEQKEKRMKGKGQKQAPAAKGAVAEE